MTATHKKVETWDSLEGEESMQSGHEPSWQALVRHMDEQSLEGKSVLDFGCNRGGFLRRLHAMKPFAFGLGVDIAEDSVAAAQAAKGDRPLEYAHNDVLAKYNGRFDIAFSHEVIYLLPDLKAHAREIAATLKPGGVYYVAIGEYAENPLWDRWKETVAEFSPVPPQTYSLQDMALAFAEGGFNVTVRRLVCDGFLPYDPYDTKYLHNPIELIEFMTEHMMLFRLVKK